MEQMQPMEPVYSLQPPAQVTADQTRLIDDGEDAFSYEGYEVIRGEYFCQSSEPQFTFSNFQVSVNAVCLRKLPGTTYVQLLINPEARKLIVRPCYEDEKDSFPWSNARHKPRKITCPIFFIKVVQLMNWNPSYRYKLLGKMLTSKTERLFIFDLKNPQIYKKIPKKLNNPTAERTPLFPAAWQQQFGQPYFEHKADIWVNIFNDVAIIGIDMQETDTATAPPTEPTAESSEPLNKERNEVEYEDTEPVTKL